MNKTEQHLFMYHDALCLMMLHDEHSVLAGGTSAERTLHAIAQPFPRLHVRPEPLPLASQNSGCIMTLRFTQALENESRKEATEGAFASFGVRCSNTFFLIMLTRVYILFLFTSYIYSLH